MSNYRLTAEDKEAFYQLYLYAFNGQDSERRRRFFSDRYDHGWIYGLKHQGRLTSALYSLPFHIDFHGVDYNMNGIGDVCSAPEYSGVGGAGILLKAALEEMAQKGVTLSYLAPFSFEYYRRFGFEQVFNHLTYRLDHQQVPAYHPEAGTGSITRLPFPQAVAQIAPLYAKHDHQRSGGMNREAWWWHYLGLKNAWDVGVYQDDAGAVQGYVTYLRDGSSLRIHEFIAETRDAFEQLMRFVLKHGNTFLHLEFESPDPAAHADWFKNPYPISATVTPYMMARIVDLKDFLQRYPYLHDFKPLRFYVADPVLPANQGTWQLARANGQTHLSKLSGEKLDATDFAATIQALTKVLFGTVSLAQMAISGGRNWQGPAALALPVHQETPQFNDYF